MMNISQINTAIIQGTWTNDQLSSMIDAVKFARARLTEQSKRSLRIGDNVNFTSSKTGQNYTGLVTKIAIKFVTVRTAQGLWKVPANMLTKIEDREYA
jgi:small-conductance mechanosensitive channel